MSSVPEARECRAQVVERDCQVAAPFFCAVTTLPQHSLPERFPSHIKQTQQEGIQQRCHQQRLHALLPRPLPSR